MFEENTIPLERHETVRLDGARLATCASLLVFALGVWALAGVGLAELLGIAP